MAVQQEQGVLARVLLLTNRYSPLLSIVIPAGPQEDQLNLLVNDLKVIPDSIEILIVYSELSKSIIVQEKQRIIQLPGKKSVRWVLSPPGRAEQMNTGAKEATGRFIWFLHADSRLAENTYPVLKRAIFNQPEALHFFTFVFIEEKRVRGLKISEFGARFRSRLLGIPFGDQGFCIKKSLFERIGMYPEQLAYGEDHLFVWRARQFGISLSWVGEKLFTSARKYVQYGWWYVAYQNFFLWTKQAIPELKTLLQSRGIL